VGVVARLDEIVGSIALAAMTLLVVVEVVFRYVLNDPLFWSLELAGVLGIWTAFLGASVAIRHRAHLGVDFFVDLLPPRARSYLSIVADVCTAIALAILFYYGGQLALQSIKMTMALHLPYWVINAAVPVGSGLMLVHSLVETVRRARQVLRDPATAAPVPSEEVSIF
jgi:TRAP-type C4-dicarboxylate transport system permease small subunit